MLCKLYFIHGDMDVCMSTASIRVQIDFKDLEL
jgi:hypothetical protein